MGSRDMDVVVVEDSKPFQDVVARLLSSVEGLEIVGMAEDVDGACSLIDAKEPDVVVLDVELRDGGRGIDVLRHVVREHPRVKVIGLSNRDWEFLRPVFLRAGAAACFDKATEFVQARDWLAACARARPIRPGIGPHRGRR